MVRVPSFELRQEEDGCRVRNRLYIPHDLEHEPLTLSELTAPTIIGDPAELSDAELHLFLHRLEREEQSISRRRTTLHTRIDFVRAGGYASTDPEHESLAALQATELEISEQRLGLHAQIDALWAERTRRRI